jgi:hypothetical protein
VIPAGAVLLQGARLQADDGAAQLIIHVSLQEDEILKQQVARFGTHCWPEVAAGLAGRTSKACSLR